MKRKKKGDYGYLYARKKNYLIKSILFILIGIAIFITGLLLYKRNAKNIFTVLAILMSLPFAKSMVEFIVLFPYHDPSMEMYQRIKKVDLKDMDIYSGLVITSSEKIMNLDFLVEGQGTVIGLAGKKGQDIRYIDDYLTKGIKSWGAGYNVKILGEEKAFFQAMENIKPHEYSEEERKEVVSYIRSLII